MAGLTNTGFVPSTYDEIKDRIESKINTLNAGFDFAPESPDGQLIGIMTFEISEAWSQLNTVYLSHSPTQATGAALRNIGLITGLPYGAASRSRATVDLDGVLGTLVPRNSAVSNGAGDIFTTSFDAYLPASVEVTASVAGPIAVGAGSITTVVSTVVGWTSVAQPAAGLEGLAVESETAYRNKRQKTVMRSSSSVAEVIQARLIEAGVEQANVFDNKTLVTAIDGTPSQHLHVTVNDVVGLTDEDIARIILTGAGLGTPTYGSTSVSLLDSQGITQVVNFTKATAVDVFVELDVTYLSSDVAGANEAIRNALVAEINSYPAGGDVIHSRLYGVITPFAKAQINSLRIGTSLAGLAMANIPLDVSQFANTSVGSISITVT